MEEQDEVLDVGQAAARLGISADGVRKRIRRGTLRAHKRDGEWMVVLSGVPLVSPESRRVLPETVPDTKQDAALGYFQYELGRLQHQNDRQGETIAEQARTITALVAQLGEVSKKQDTVSANVPAVNPALVIQGETMPADTTTPASHHRPKRTNQPLWERLVRAFRGQ